MYNNYVPRVRVRVYVVIMAMIYHGGKYDVNNLTNIANSC